MFSDWRQSPPVRIEARLEKRSILMAEPASKSGAGSRNFANP